MRQTNQTTSRDVSFRIVAIAAVVALAVFGFAVGCDEPAADGDDGQMEEQEFDEPVLDDDGRPHFEDIADEADEAAGAAEEEEADEDEEEVAEEDEADEEEADEDGEEVAEEEAEE